MFNFLIRIFANRHLRPLPFFVSILILVEHAHFWVCFVGLLFMCAQSVFSNLELLQMWLHATQENDSMRGILGWTGKSMNECLKAYGFLDPEFSKFLAKTLSNAAEDPIKQAERLKKDLFAEVKARS